MTDPTNQTKRRPRDMYYSESTDLVYIYDSVNDHYVEWERTGDEEDALPSDAVRLAPQHPLGSDNLEIVNGWLVERTNEHTCAGGTPEASGMHEESCGLEPIVKLSTLRGFGQMESERLAAELSRLRAENERLEAIIRNIKAHYQLHTTTLRTRAERAEADLAQARRDTDELDGPIPRWDEDQVVIDQGWVEVCGRCGEELPGQSGTTEPVNEQQDTAWSRPNDPQGDR